MEGKKNNFMGDIYSSYGPFVGKVCENANTQLHHDNIIESITSSICPNSANISNHISPVDNIVEGKTINILQDMGSIDAIPMVKSTCKIRGSKKIKFGGDTNTNSSKPLITEPVISDKSTLVHEKSESFFNYKISIYNHKISIWILLLILLVIICIGYFIYKYWYLKNTSIITYKKSNSDEINKSIGEENSSTDTDNESNDTNTSTSSSG